MPGYNPDPFTLDNGPGWGWLAMLLPYAEQAPLCNATNFNLPDLGRATTARSVTTQINVFLCPSANNPTPTCPMVDANLNLLPVANPYFARANYQYNMGWNDTSIQPPNTNYDDPIAGLQRADLPEQPRPLRRGDRRPEQHRLRRREDALPGRRDLGGDHPRLPALRLQRLRQRRDGRGRRQLRLPGAILASHSGPSLYEVPQVIHPPNSPLGHTDEFYSLHPGGANVLMGDGSVRFIKQSINLLAWQALSSRANGEVISADAY